MTTDTEARVRRIVSEVLGVEEADIKHDSDLLTDLHGDSLDTVEIIMDLEEEFGVEISDDDMESARTFGDLLKVVAEADAA